MKITCSTEGGFAAIPALQVPFEVDTDDLDPETASELERYVRESDFFDSPHAQIPLPSGAADLRSYSITVQDGTRIQTVRLADPVPAGPLERLVTRLNALRQPEPREP
jgi:hypothetical protein